MNQHLQNILNFLQQDKNLSDEEKNALIKSVKDADKEFEITSFKLDRTEKVKRTTAILLEETIEELEQKRKAVEAQNRELEIESSLERVRTVAMGMSKPDDLLNICEALFKELQLLGFSELRNAMIHKFIDEQGYFLDHDYSDFAGGAITHTPYTGHPVVEKFMTEIRKTNDAFSEIAVAGKELEDWKQFRITNGQAHDPRLDGIPAFYYYFYSIGPADIGISTFSSISTDKRELLKRFRNVFDLAYRRFLDIEKAEAQAHEAKIETSLERVRAQAMAMRTPEDLTGICEVLHTELHSLGFPEMRNAMINIHDDEKGTFINYDYSDEIGKSTNHLRYDIHPVIEKQIRQMRSAGDAFSETYFKGKDLEDWKDFRKKIGEKDDPRIENTNELYYYFYSIGTGSIGISTFSAITEEKLNVLKRFRNVFDFAYRRYIDVANAEAQAKEAQIQLALERVRARTMAMQKSNELADAAALLFQQVKNLGIETYTSGFNIWDEEHDALVSWMANPSGIINPPFIMPAKEYGQHKRFYEAWKNNIAFKEDDLVDERIKDHYKYLRSFPLLETAFAKAEQAGIKTPGRQVHNAVFFSHGYILFVTLQPEPGLKELFQRFGQVFQQTYTRFLDLQKAEAQSREAQIELALERVRARTMAMQKSDELLETSLELFQQLKELGEPAEQLTIGVIKEEEGIVEVSATLKGSKLLQAFRHDLNEPYVVNKMFEAWKAKKKTLVIEQQWEELIEYNRIRNKLVQSDMFPVDLKPGDQRVLYVAFYSRGTLALSSNEPRPKETLELLERFAKVFDQTYTRFLDLQKAEAQAKEAQIETALERVRSRSMGMQKSEELKEVIKIVYQQLTHLKINLDHAGFVVDYAPRGDWHFWIADEQDIPSKITHPYFESVWAKQFNEAKEKGIDLFATNLNFEEKNKFYNELLSYVPGLPQASKDFYLSCPGLAASTVLLENVGLYIENFSGTPYTEEENTTLMRLGKVFQQTYTRFLDLQKAEAQAREAQIETGLERVRSRSLAMHNTSDLQEVIRTVHQELLGLNIAIDGGSFIAINNDINDALRCWGSGDTAHISEEIHLPVYKKPFCTDLINGIKNGPGFFTEAFSQEEKKEFFNFLFQYEPWSKLDAKEKEATLLSPGGYTRSVCVSKHTSIFIINHLGEAFWEADNDILKRFAKVFEQTYTRFLDLQKAEAQSREAQIELGLERVRARAMAMQTSEELNALSGTVFTELTKLDLVLTRCVIMIYDPLTNDSRWWMANSEAPEQPMNFTVQNHELPPYTAFIKAWQERQVKWVYALEGKTKKVWDDFLFTQTGLSQLPDFVIAGMKEPKRVFLNSSFFNFGSISLPSLEPLPDEHFDIMLRFSKVFDLTYTRFSDLKLAEAQAKEAKIEAALEKVRSRTMAMQSSNELQETAAVLFQEFKKLGAGDVYQVTIGIYNEEEGLIDFRVTSWAGNGEQENRSFNLDMKEPTVMQPSVAAWKANKKSLVVDLTGETLEGWINYRNKMSGVTISSKDTEGRRVISIAYFSKGHISISTPLPVPQETIKTLERFAAVFDGTYTRFLDLEKAEAQARESQIEAALERVRSKAMAMQKSDDLANAVAIVFEELDKLNLGMLRCGIGILNKEKRCAQVWTTTVSENNTVVQVSGDESMDIHPLLRGAFEAWIKQEDHSYVLQGEDLNNYYKAVAGENFKLPDSQSLVAGNEGIKQFYYNAVWSSGGLFAFRKTEFPEEAKIVLRRFADVFDFTYTRFNDLKQAEAQAREAKIEAALERVRSRTLAMQKSDELAETAAEVFRQLIGLGIEPNRLYIGIVKEDTGDMEMWATDEDGTHVGRKFMFNKNENASVKKLFDGWEAKEKSVIVDMQGKELEDYFHYLNDVMHIPFKSGLTQKRRVQSVAYFSKGFIGMASPDGQGDETIQLLERFAAVFNLTFTRFNDLKVAEAHALQAEEDLVKLQTEKKRAEDALTELRSTQTQLIQSEKMASLGELTAGIAHEIQNPLNFVNNFSEVSNELIEELKEERAKVEGKRDKQLEEELLNDIKQNLEKINHHGKRADAIVKGMLQHSRATSATKEPTDINKLADEYLRLAYHGLRAKDKSFNATLKTNYDESIENINLIPQDIGRVVLNLITNAFYAVTEKKKASTSFPPVAGQAAGQPYEPTVTVSTKKITDKILISVKDNGKGIPQNIVDKIFQPFFTTKPTGQGTGLGLSLAYDIVKAHGGELKVETKEGEGTVFIILLPA